MTSDDPTRMPGVGGDAAPDPDATIIARAAGMQRAASSGTGSPPRPVEGNLPQGYRLEQFEVHEQLGRGGFSVVYKVFDHRLEQFRALKEYFPRDFAMRMEGLRVQPRSQRDEEIFGIGLNHFVAEGKTLAKFNHPSLVHVYQTIEANGTAYMVMQLAEGDTLEDTVKEMPTPPDEGWLMKLLDAVTAALTIVHDASIVHRDIKPENIVLLHGSQRPVLLDFGAARRIIDRAGQPTGILTPGYAPIEQYPDSGLEQGPWTDIYALAASVHRLLIGNAPPNALARQMKDGYEPLARRLAGGRYSDRLLKTLDACLTIDPAKRPRTVDDLRHRLGLHAGTFDPAAPAPAATVPGRSGRGSPLLWSGVGAAALVVLGVVVFLVINGSGPQPAPAPQVAQAPAAAPSAAVPVPSPTPTPVPPEPASAATAAPGPAAGPGSEQTTSTPPADAPPPAMPQPAPAAPPATGAAGSALPSEPGAAFDHIVASASAAFDVRLSIRQPRLEIGKTMFQLQLASAKSGHFYVLIHDTDGEVRVLHPDAAHPDSRIAAGKQVSWPADGDTFPFGEPPGKARILVVVSGVPLDLGPATKTRDGVWRVLYKGADAGKAAAAMPAGRHLYLGLPNCPKKVDGSACDGSYGAASAMIEVVR